MNSRLLDYIYWLEKLSKETKFRVVVLEKNCYTHTLRRALGHAHSINELQRLKHEIPIICSANCLQPYKQNDNNWDQGFVFFLKFCTIVIGMNRNLFSVGIFLRTKEMYGFPDCLPHMLKICCCQGIQESIIFVYDGHYLLRGLINR